jgi:3-methylcrotonyl-CoA carboxylase alpha subunit
MSVLIANRGEIACRVIRACKALGLTTIAVYSDADENAKHVMEADQALHIGASKPQESYLNVDALLHAARVGGAHAVHPGYGFLSESERFANAVEDAGLVWIGPRPESIALMGDKGRARQIASGAGVPVLPGSGRFDVGSLEGLAQAGAEVGFPLLVKAAGGGGGIGMRRVDAPAQLHDLAHATQNLAERSFGDGTIFLERLVANARHVEVQVFGFGDGDAVHLFERECSIQRRFQKILEESPSPGISAATRQAMTEAALKLTRTVKYRGAGTIEFVVDADTEAFYFLEMNTRIQVEHPVTEMVTGVDLVALQLRLALGLPLDREALRGGLRQSGHAIEVRICAEDPARKFLPSPGLISRLRFPIGDTGVRVDSGVREGDRLTPFYDSMIAKLICHGPTRADAIDTLRAALAATDIEGIRTNMAFLRQIADHPSFVSGQTLTSFIDVEMNTPA